MPSINFECTKCGECCTNFNQDNVVFVFPEDAERIAQAFSIAVDEFYQKYCYEESIETTVGVLKVFMLKNLKGNCVFLADKICSIHGIKPTQCVRGPFGFFWDSSVRFDCMKEVIIPNDWNTEQDDIQLVKQLLKR